MTSSDNHLVGSLDATLPNFLKHDGPAGTVVFLVALPLCLGIALASGAPLFAGIIAGVIGGIVVSVLSGSQVSVSGPAAGLAAIVAVAIQDVGYPSFLLALVIGGMIQFVLGTVKFGVIANYVPNSVIKGMLAAIGIVIILKQIPHALGRDKSYEGNFTFLEAGGNNTLSDIAEAVVSASAGAVIIAGISLMLLIFWDKLGSRSRFLQLLPGPLVVVALGIALNQAFGVWAPWLRLVEPEHLVNLPIAASGTEFLRQFTLPDFSAIGNSRVWVVAVTLAAVASLESLLSLEAADRLDPYKRISPPNRELRAQGIGNLISGMIGGLPVTTVAVRTSANVYAGARTWMSSFIHGVLLLAAVLLIPGVLKLTPLASLAAILIVVGLKLTKVSLYRKMYALGWDQFVPFITTVVAVVFSDLLIGVLIGIVCGAFFVIRTNHHEAITVVSQGHNYLMRFTKDASFVNKNEFRDKLRQIPSGSHVLIDGTRALFIDHDIMEAVVDFQDLAPYKNIQVELKQWESYKL
jgi:MFS superfamily sulfate permease-like transporter